MERITPEIVEHLKEEGHTVYSFSRLETINQCRYQAKLQYLDKVKSMDNVYSILGGKIHDVLEDIINNKATKEDLLIALNDELEMLELLGLDFPKDSKGGNSIRESWIYDMKHFCNSYEKPDGKFETETFCLFKTPKEHYVQGYIDLIKHNDDDTIDIIDYKTSTIYSGKDIADHGRQLIIYALGKQQEGFKVNRIGWNFLKYCSVEYYGKKTAKSKKEELINKIVERRKIADTLTPQVTYTMSTLGYDETDISLYIMQFKETNNFSVLPPEVADRFKISQAIVYYDLSEENIKDCIKYVDKTIEKWEALTEYKHKDFEKYTKGGKKVEDTFFCNTLCGYRKYCEYLKEYNDKKEFDKINDEDLFG